jgi:hypothetical protein
MKNLTFPSYTPRNSRRSTHFTPARKKGAKPKHPIGSTDDLYPVVLDNGRTIIWITDRSREQEIRVRYAS